MYGMPWQVADIMSFIATYAQSMTDKGTRDSTPPPREPKRARLTNGADSGEDSNLN
jgi:hypothetical protein